MFENAQDVLEDKYQTSFKKYFASKIIFNRKVRQLMWWASLIKFILWVKEDLEGMY